MFSRFWFLFGFVSACTGGMLLPACEDTVLVSSPDAGASNDQINALCIDDTLSDESQIFLRAVEAKPACPSQEKEVSLEVFQATPQTIFLSGTRHVEYCIDLHLHRGAIAIDPVDGAVEQAADWFTWCVVPKDDWAVQLTIRSLAASAKMKLFVP